MAELIEFSKIAIFKDTPRTRYAFGPPIDPATLKATGRTFGSTVPQNPFYSRLVGDDIATTQNGGWQGGWRSGYPNLDDVFKVGGASSGNPWGGTDPVTDYLLNAIGKEENTNVGYNLQPQSSGTGIIVDNKFYVGDPDNEDYLYSVETTFTSPNPALVVGDFIFWGLDPNGLNIGGKIAQVYAPGSTDYNSGARYRFEKNTKVAFPLDTNDVPVPQNIYYYRRNWNGKGIKNDENTGFYVLIGIEQSSPQIYSWYPYLGGDGYDPNSYGPNYSVIDVKAGGQTVDYTKRLAFTDLIRVRKISNSFEADQTIDQFEDLTTEIIPCSIHRTSNFYYSPDQKDSNGVLQNIFGNNAFINIAPQWVAYYVNPYGLSNSKLNKNSTYVIEINERLPAANLPTSTGLYTFAKSGDI